MIMMGLSRTRHTVAEAEHRERLIREEKSKRDA